MIDLPKAILFDLDDTLISFEGVSDLAWHSAIGRLEIQVPDLFSLIKSAQTWYWGHPERHKTGRENIREARREIVRRALKPLGFEHDHIPCALADDYTDTHNAMVCIYPNTIPVLNALKLADVRMVLITNGSASGQRAKLKRFGLKDYFDFILIDQELGFGKPDIRVFTHALNLLGLASVDVWMVGDNLVWDIGPPQKIGIHAIWHDWESKGINANSAIVPDRVINDIGELIHLI